MNRESDDITKPSQPGDNVVRLPRDWLGPREELVPLEGTTGAAASAGAPPRADDFWGEDSAALQDPWQAPAEPVGVSDRPSARTRRRRARFAAFATEGRRRWGATIALIAAVAATGIGVAYSGNGASPQRSSDRPAAQLAADIKLRVLAAGTKLRVGHARVSQALTYRKPQVHRPRVHHRRLPVKHTDKGRAGGHKGATSASQSSSGAPTAVPETTDTSGTSFVANPTPQHEDSMTSATKSSPGPTGAGAPFAPGYIP